MKKSILHNTISPVATILVVTIIGCDSGGSENNETTENVTPSMPGPTGTDATAPQVIAFQPLDGSIEIAPDTVVRAVFDEDMFAPSLDAMSITVTDENGESVAGDVTFDASDNSVSFVPAEPLDMSLGNSYNVALADTITDLSGNALEPVEWSFAAMEHDCNPYEAATITETFGGEWRPAGLFRESWVYESPTTPDEPGGGYYRLRLMTTHPDGEQFADPVIIASQGEGTNILFAGSAPSVYETVIGVIPNTVYDIVLHNGWAVTADQPPVTWQYERTYVGVMDCYEPNDQRFFEDAEPTARKIPLNITLEAYAKPGFDNRGSINIDTPSWYDWYRIVLTQTSEVSLEIVSTPSDTALRSLLFDSAAIVPLIDAEGVNPGRGDVVPKPYQSEPRVLEAGTYYVQIYPAAVIPNWQPILSDGDPVTDAYITPYRFRVNAAPVEQ